LNNFGQFGDGTNNSSWSGTMGAGGMDYSILAASSMPGPWVPWPVAAGWLLP
jgi:hypothetical protein